MLAEDIYAIMLFSSLILVVPGPSNTLLLSAGFHFGSLRAAPLHPAFERWATRYPFRHGAGYWRACPRAIHGSSV